jgi:phosphoglycolate phosphatase-like HAD superfamily hydrolase
MSQYTTALFDLDGVLIDSYNAWFNLLNDAAKSFGYNGVNKEQYDLLYGQSVEADIKTLFPGLEISRLKDYFEAHFFDYLGDFELMPGSQGSLKLAKELGFKTAIVTNTSKKLATDIIKHVNLSPDLLIGSGDAENDKPAPDMLLLACDRLESSTSESIMIGDSGFDSRAAAAAEIVFIGFKREGNFRVEDHKELQALLKEIKSDISIT